MRIRVSASSAPNGSSSSSSAGSRTSARASATRCASPPESVLGQSRSCACELDLASAARPRSRASGPRRPSTTLSSTRAHGSSRASWNTTARRAGTTARPSKPSSRPASARSNVLLPLPLRPSSARNSPSRSSRSRSSSTTPVAERPPDRRARTTTVSRRHRVGDRSRRPRCCRVASDHLLARHCRALLSRSRMSASDARPSTAYTARPTTMMSVRKNSWAWIIR